MLKVRYTLTLDPVNHLILNCLAKHFEVNLIQEVSCACYNLQKSYIELLCCCTTEKKTLSTDSGIFMTLVYLLALQPCEFYKAKVITQEYAW